MAGGNRQGLRIEVRPGASSGVNQETVALHAVVIEMKWHMSVCNQGGTAIRRPRPFIQGNAGLFLVAEPGK